MKNGKMKTAPASVISASESAPRKLEQDQEDQRVLQEIVVERAEELAPEQRRKAPCRHQGFEHGFGLCRLAVRCREFPAPAMTRLAQVMAGKAATLTRRKCSRHRPGVVGAASRSRPISRRSALASSSRLTSLPPSCTSRSVLVTVMQDWINNAAPMAK